MVDVETGTPAEAILADSRSDNASPVSIACGRYDSRVSLANAAHPALRRQSRIWSTKPKSREPVPYIPIATDGSSIFHGDKLYSARDFINGLALKERKLLLTLTIREVDLLLPICLDFDAVSTALESAFPVFSGIKYSDPLPHRLRALEVRLRLLRKIGVQGPTLTQQLVREASYRTERAIRSKNGLDQFFSLSSPAPYQEVFKIREERHGRAIVALDFNSMYGSCMEGEFPEPRSLRYRLHDGEELTTGDLRVGLYRTVLSHPHSDFFCKYHPLKFTQLGTSFPFRIEGNHAIEALLWDNELKHYSRFFGRVQVIESITSQKSIRHPLAVYAQQLYKERQQARARGQDVKERVLKMQLASLHSVTSQRRYVSKFFIDTDSLLQYVCDTFQVEFPTAMSVEEKLERLGRFGFIRLKYGQRGIRARILNSAASDALQALSFRVFANARLKMVRLLERVTASPGVDVCYVNADCVHVSIERSRLSFFLQEFSDELSQEMGGLRVQCIADRGYWFDPGRYWLISNGQVIQFANKVFNHPGAEEKFHRRRRIRTAYRGDIVSFAVDRYLSIEHAFSYSKRLKPSQIDNQDYERYKYEEVFGLEVAGDSVESEILRSKGTKIELFDRIATDTVSSDSGATRRIVR